MSSSDSSNQESSAAARIELGELEQEIARVKALLRELGSHLPVGAESPSSPTTDTSSSSNTLTVAWISTEGWLESEAATMEAQFQLRLQLSSPVESAVLRSHVSSSPTSPELSALDPKSASVDLVSTETGASVYTFRGVDTGHATLTFVATREDTQGADVIVPPIGMGMVDLAPLVKFDVLKLESVVDTTVTVELRKQSSSSPLKEEDKDKIEERQTNQMATDHSDPPLCTVTLRLSFVPSSNDRREELYEVLNKATQGKAAAVERLRTAAMAEQRSKMQSTTEQEHDSGSNTTMVRSGDSAVNKSTSTATSSSPAVRSGFLNNNRVFSSKEGKNTIQLWCDTHLGPNSLIRQIFPIARNYVIFAVAVGFMHWKGHLLALPAPV